MDPLTLFARHVWPILRPFVNHPKRCELCIVLLKDGEQQVCRLCLQYSPRKIPPSIRPLQINETDSLLLLLSGGKDGVYVLGRLREEYPRLPIECVLIDTGFLGPKALIHAQAATEKADVSFTVIRSHKNRFRDILREAFLGLKHSSEASCYDVVDHAEGSLIFDIGTQLAQENGQRLVSGLTSQQLSLIEGAATNDDLDALYPLDVWRPSEQEIYDKAHILVGKKSDFTPLATNSTLIPLMLAVDILRFGYSSFEPEFAKGVREGKFNRTVWLHRFEALKWLTENGHLDPLIEELCTSINIARKEILP